MTSISILLRRNSANGRDMMNSKIMVFLKQLVATRTRQAVTAIVLVSLLFSLCYWFNPKQVSKRRAVAAYNRMLERIEVNRKLRDVNCAYISISSGNLIKIHGRVNGAAEIKAIKNVINQSCDPKKAFIIANDQTFYPGLLKSRIVVLISVSTNTYR